MGEVGWMKKSMTAELVVDSTMVWARKKEKEERRGGVSFLEGEEEGEDGMEG